MRTTGSAIPVAQRIDHFSYAIRNIVGEARKVEAAGRRVHYLNIGDPVAFGFQPPQHLVAAVERAVTEGHNGYVASPGIVEAREAVALDMTARGVQTHSDRVVVTSGTSEGIELALAALLDPEDEVLVPSPTYPLYTAVIAKLGGCARYYRTDPHNGWLPDVDHVASLVSAKTKALVVIDPNNPTGAVYPTDVRRALLSLSERHGLVLLADEVYLDLAYSGPIPPLATFDQEAAVISFSSLSKAFLTPGWRAGWLIVGRTPRLDGVLAAIKKLADGRLCSPGPMQYAIAAALTGDRSHVPELRRALHERAVLTTRRFNAILGMTCVEPHGAFYAMPKIALPPGRTDEDYVLALLRGTGVLCVHGSGFGTEPTEGYFRVVYLADPRELDRIYDLVENFTREYLAR